MSGSYFQLLTFLTFLFVPAFSQFQRACDLSNCQCSTQYVPFCGNDEITYSNICSLNCAQRQCNRELKVKFEGVCAEKYVHEEGGSRKQVSVPRPIPGARKPSAQYTLSATHRPYEHSTGLRPYEFSTTSRPYRTSQIPHNFPTTRRPYEYPTTRRTYEYPTTRRSYDTPTTRRTYEYPTTSRSYETTRNSNNEYPATRAPPTSNYDQRTSGPNEYYNQRPAFSGNRGSYGYNDY